MAIPAIKLALISLGTLGTGTVAVGAPLVHFGVISLPGGKGGKGETPSAKAPSPEARSVDAVGSGAEKPSNPNSSPVQTDVQKPQESIEEQPSKAAEEGTNVEQPQPQPLSSEDPLPTVDSAHTPFTDGSVQEPTLSTQGQVVDGGQTQQGISETSGDNSETTTGSPAGAPESHFSDLGSSSDGVSTGTQSSQVVEGGAGTPQGSEVATQGQETSPSTPATDTVQTGQENAVSGGKSNPTNGEGGTVQVSQ